MLTISSHFVLKLKYRCIFYDNNVFGTLKYGIESYMELKVIYTLSLNKMSQLVYWPSSNK